MTGEVCINGDTEEQHVTLSFRQISQCDGGSGDETIEVKSLNVANLSSYAVESPVGTYPLMVSTYVEDTQVIDLKVTDTEDPTLDINSLQVKLPVSRLPGSGVKNLTPC